jgi:ribosomal-protein-alanine N-acetyltransferase
MDTIALVPPAHADLDALLAFELANRAFFEATINARPPAYYSREGVARAIDAAIDQAANDRAYQFLVKSAAGELLGRINLSGIKRAHFHSGVLGYRIGQPFGGRGIASAALRQLLEIAFGPLGLKRIEADASVENGGSIRVLERNGFVQFGRSRRSFELQGIWYDRLHFERHVDAPVNAPARPPDTPPPPSDRS